jgi:hypothetical protein
VVCCAVTDDGRGLNCGESAKSWCGVSCFRYDEDMCLDMLCGVVENVLERWCGAVEAGPFAMVEGE